MEQKAVNEEQFFRYLLGELPEEEMSKLEESYFLDDDLLAELQAAERELIDLYLAGGLSERQKYEFEHFFLSSPVRQERLSFARALKEHDSKQTARRRRYSSGRLHIGLSRTKRFVASPAGLFVSIMLIAFVGLGIWRVFFYQSAADKGIAALKYAYSSQRPLQVRISGFDYAPDLETRGDQSKIDYTSRSRAEKILLDAIFEDPGPASHHALGRFYLADRQFDKAIDQFEQALAADPTNAQLHSDLGAALLERGKAERASLEEAKTLEDFANSLERFNKALELNGSLREALFNRAILFENMILPRQAEEDWRRYIEIDPRSEWADEARQHLEDLERRKKARSQSNGELLPEFIGAYRSGSDERAYNLIRGNTDAISGQLLWWQLVGAYLELASRGEAGQASDYLRALSYAGQLQKEKTGDRFIVPVR